MLQPLPYHCSDLCQVCCRHILFGEIQLYPILANIPPFRNTTLSPLSKQLCHIIAPTSATSLLQPPPYHCSNLCQVCCRYILFGEIQLYPILANIPPFRNTTLSPQSKQLCHIIAPTSAISLLQPPPYHCSNLCHIIAPTSAILLLQPPPSLPQIYTLWGNTTLSNSCKYPSFQKHNSLPSEQTTLSHHCSNLRHIIAPTSATLLLQPLPSCHRYIHFGEIQLYPILANIPPFRNTTLSPLSKQLCHIIAPTSATSLLRPPPSLSQIYTLWGDTTLSNSCKYPSFQKHNSLPSEQTTLSHHCSNLRHIIAPTYAKLPQIYTLWGDTTLSNSCKYPSFQKHNSLPSEQTTPPHHCSDLRHIIAPTSAKLPQIYTLWGDTSLSNSCKYPSFQKHNSLPSEQTTLSHHCSDLRQLLLQAATDVYTLGKYNFIHLQISLLSETQLSPL